MLSACVLAGTFPVPAADIPAEGQGTVAWPSENAEVQGAVPAPSENAEVQGAVPAPSENTEVQGAVPAPSESIEEQGAVPEPSENSGGTSVFSSKKMAETGEEVIEWNPDWPFASYSQIHTGTATLYKVGGNGYTVCVNAGHGTAGGESYQTQCHPDGTPKVTGGSTAAGSIYAIAVSSGMVMNDGTSEAVVNLQLARILKEKLMARGFNVLMIRESDDVQLDNIARTVMANQNADCHLAIHYDSSANDKGFFYISVPSNDSYRSMEPVASHWQEHNALGDAVLAGVADGGNHIFGSGSMEIDLTQTSYSTIPSIDVECGDAGSDWSYGVQEKIAEGIAEGVSRYFGVE